MKMSHGTVSACFASIADENILGYQNMKTMFYDSDDLVPPWLVSGILFTVCIFST